MIDVLISELVEIEVRRQFINETPLREIRWIQADGTPLEVTEAELREWEFIGLNNTNFPFTRERELLYVGDPDLPVVVDQ